MKELAQEIRKVNADNGWDTPSEFDDIMIPVKLCLVHSEVTEALEAFRHDDFDNFAEELADATIRILDLAEGLGIDLEHEVRYKNAINRGREYKHGGKRV